MTTGYVQMLARTAYLWSWPLVNMADRAAAFWSTIRDCTFNYPTYGIQDIKSPGGNLFVNIAWNNLSILVSAVPGGAELTGTLERCEVAAPAAP
jgi:hypothetical protein